VKFNRIPAAILVILLMFTIAPVTAGVFFTSSTPQIITKGDMFSVSGTGAKNGTIAIWIIGRNYFEVLADTPDKQGNFLISLKPSVTEKLSTGQYAVVFQDPGAGGTMEIEAGTDSFGNITIMNRGKIVAKIGARKDLRGNVQPEVAILINAAGIRGVDDTFVAGYFFVEEPSVWFDQLVPASGSRLHNQTTGDRIVFSGTTNLGTWNSLKGEIHDLNSNKSVISKPIPVLAGNTLNHWLFETDSQGLPPGDYSLTLDWRTMNATGAGSAVFTVNTPVFAMESLPLPVNEDTARQRLDLTIVIITGMLLVIGLIVYASGRK
jgi:hypothetical protein